MAYQIAVCGAGGKTSLCFELAKTKASLNKKVCVTTTTHMWNNIKLDNLSELSNIEVGKVYCFGIIDGEKIAPVSEEDYKKILEIFDYVILETDGSRMMPLKIPKQYLKDAKAGDNEPIIPEDVDEIMVVMGLHSLGREFSAVCQHANEELRDLSFDSINDKNDLVSEVLIDELIEKCYFNQLKVSYPKARIDICKVDFTKSNNYKNIKRLAIVMCASGFSKRFGDENKLFAKIDTLTEDNKILSLPLYKLMIEKLLLSKEKLIEKFDKDLSYKDLKVEIAVVSQYEEILNDADYKDKVTSIKNVSADLGLSSSIKLATTYYSNYDAIMFINADLPKLPVNEISLFLFNSICSNNSISSMFTNKLKNPAYFEKEYFDELLSISGDVGAKDLLIKYIKDSYKYHINEKYLYDIDTKEDLKLMDGVNNNGIK